MSPLKAADRTHFADDRLPQPVAHRILCRGILSGATPMQRQRHSGRSSDTPARQQERKGSMWFIFWVLLLALLLSGGGF
jgi:hypothetical protein